MKVTPGFRVSIDAEALERIWHWTNFAKGEFSCLGSVSDELHVHDVQLFEQTCTASSTDMDQVALAKFLCGQLHPERVRAWIHSHGNLNVFWSPQDDHCIEGLENDTVLVSIVVNKRREMKCRVDLWHPVRLTLDDLMVEVRVPRYGLKAECEAAFRDLVTEAPLAQQQRTGPQGQAALLHQHDFADWSAWDDGPGAWRLP